LTEEENKPGSSRSRRCTGARNETARQGMTTEGRRGLVTYLKKKMGTFRQVVVVSVRKSPTLVVCRAVLGFPAPNSLDTLQAQHMHFHKTKTKHYAFWHWSKESLRVGYLGLHYGHAFSQGFRFKS